MYDPWTEIAFKFPHLAVDATQSIQGADGVWEGEMLRIDCDLSPVGQRSLLAKEIAHLEYPEISGDAASVIAAHRLIDSYSFCATLSRAVIQSFPRLCAELDVDAETLVAYVGSLSEDESAHLAGIFNKLVVDAFTAAPAEEAA